MKEACLASKRRKARLTGRADSSIMEATHRGQRAYNEEESAYRELRRV